MKISEKFDFVMEYLKKIGGGEFMRCVRLNIFFPKKKKMKSPFRLCCSTLTFQNVKFYILKCKPFFA